MGTLIASNLVFRLSRLVGSIPYDARGKLSKFLTIYFLITTLGLAVPYIGLRAMHLRFSMTNGSKLQITQVLVAVSVSMSLISSNLAHVVQCLTKRKAIEYILQNVTINRLSHCCIFDSIIIVTGTMAHGAFLYFGIFDTNYYNISEKSTAQLVYQAVMVTVYCANFYNFTMVMQFSSIVGAMAGHLNDMTFRIQKEFHGSRCLQYMRVAKILNGFYNWQIALALAQLCGFTVTYLYKVLSDWMEGGMQKVKSRILPYGIHACMAVIRVATLWIIADRPHRFNEAIQAFNNELFKMMCSNRVLCRDRKLFLHVTMGPTVKFTACGFFNLGYPLVTSIISAVTTYLVILLQFSMQSTNK